MSDSSSITGATNPAGLPEKFTFNISHEEAGLVFGMAKRYAPEPFMGYRFQLHFEGSMRRWVMREQNIDIALSNGFGFGGHNGSVIIGPAE